MTLDLRLPLRTWLVLSHLVVLTLPFLGFIGTGALAYDLRMQTKSELVNQGALIGLLVEREADMAGAITRLLTDEQLRRRMGEAATSRSDLFRWERTAYETLAVLAGHRDR